MRVVVTGGAGFLGSHLCKSLLRLGHEVLCIDNLITGRRENILSLEAHRSFQFLLQDVSSPIRLDSQIDAVLHLASPASPADYAQLPIETMKTGAFGTYNALELARTTGARFLLASTSEVYGDPLVNPQPESYWGNINPIGPRSVYDESKRFAEALTLAYFRRHSVDVRIARIFNTYGPGMRIHDGRMISNFIVQALQGKSLSVYGDGSQTRSLCYVQDTVRGLVLLVMTGEKSYDGNGARPLLDVHEPVNVGNPAEMKVIEIGKLILELIGSTSRIEYSPLPQDDPKVRCPDIARAQMLLQWNPRVNLRIGIRKTIRYFQAVLGLDKRGKGNFMMQEVVEHGIPPQ